MGHLGTPGASPVCRLLPDLCQKGLQGYGGRAPLISAGCVCTVISRPSSGPGPCPALLAPSHSQEGLVLDLVLFGALLPGRVSEKYVSSRCKEK